jgi:hypothetical protein
MILKRFMAMVVAAALTLSGIPLCWADESAPAANESVDDGGSWAGAGMSNVIFIPSKGVTCAASGVLWFATMALTGGSKYQMAGNFVHNACTGKWVIKAEDMDAKKNWFLED